MIKLINIFLTGWFMSVGCVPFVGKSGSENFIGEGTNEIATALFQVGIKIFCAWNRDDFLIFFLIFWQGFVHEDSNMVFSPLGYSTVLAIFAEGARGESRDEIASALHFPDDVEAVRNSYREILERLVVS